MRRINRRRIGLKRWTLFVAAAVAIGVGIGAALAQVTPSTGNGTDIQTLLQQFGSLFGTGTGTTTTTGTTTPSTTTQPSGGSGNRQPLVDNQFNTTQGASLQARRPGIWIQNGIAEHMGTLDSITGDVPAEQPNFFKATFDQIALGLINGLANLLSGFNALAGVNPSSTGSTGTTGTTGTTSGGLTTISNPATSGAGTSTPIQ